MENFKYVYEMHGITITNASKEDSIMRIRIETNAISMNCIKSIELIKGNDGHVYRLEVIEANKEYGKLILTLYYLDLNETKVNRI